MTRDSQKTSEIVMQTVDVPLKPGAYVTLYKGVDMDSDGGFAAGVLYEGRVEKHVPETGLIKMEDGTSKHELYQMIGAAEGVQIIEP